MLWQSIHLAFGSDLAHSLSLPNPHCRGQLPLLTLIDLDEEPVLLLEYPFQGATQLDFWLVSLFSSSQRHCLLCYVVLLSISGRVMASPKP